MPKRPRTHEIEDESRNALRSALPSGWIFRDEAADYGIDGNVEIVVDQEVTGARFHVQLKATEAAAKAQKVTLETDRLRYYASLDQPVLIVRYEAESGQLFARWSHSFALSYDDSEDAQKRVTLHFEDGDVWDDTTPGRLVEELQTWRRLRSAQFHLPVTVRIGIDAAAGFLDADLVYALRQIEHDVQDAVRLFQTTTEPVDAELTVADGVISVAVLGATRVSGDYDLGDDDPAVVAADAFSLIALAFGRLGQARVTASITPRVFTRSTLVSNVEAVMTLTEPLIGDRRVSEVLDLARSLAEDDREDVRASAPMVTLLLKVRHGGLANAQLEEIGAIHDVLIERALELGGPAEISAAHYNAANHWRSCARGAMALPHYRRALKAYPGYGQRSYFWEELAGVLFELGFPKLSERCYAEAIRLGADGATLALHADALLFSGRYREAGDAFDSYLASSDRGVDDGEWALKHRLVRRLVEDLGLDRQDRQTSTAEKLAGEESSEDPLSTIAKLKHVLSMDALCGLAWFNLGVTEAQQGDEAASADAFIACVLIQKGDAEAWANAILLSLALEEEEEGLFATLVTTGHRLAGPGLRQSLSNLARSQHGAFPVNEFLQMVDAVLEDAKEERGDGLVRSASPDDGFESLVLSGDDGE